MSTSNFKYGYAWAQGIVEAFTERYPRGTKILAENLGLPTVELARRLIFAVRQDKQLKWEAMKLVIKKIERGEAFMDGHFDTSEAKYYTKVMLYEAEDEILDSFELKGS